MSSSGTTESDLRGRVKTAHHYGISCKESDSGKEHLFPTTIRHFISIRLIVAGQDECGKRRESFAQLFTNVNSTTAFALMTTQPKRKFQIIYARI